MLKQPDWESTPIIVCTNTKLVDSELLPISDSYWEYKCYRENMFADKYYHCSIITFWDVPCSLIARHEI